MTRKDFILTSCTACLAVTAAGTLLSSCASTHYISGNIVADGLTLSKTDFLINGGKNAAYRSFVIVRNESLQYPVCIYRFSDQEYSALWMRCSHQGSELQASGDILQCPAHGSEFNNRGVVTNGPADTNLRTFPVKVTDQELFIDLRKQS